MKMKEEKEEEGHNITQRTTTAQTSSLLTIGSSSLA
jgi:hypothetical protein